MALLDGHKSLMKSSQSGLDFAASVVSVAFARTPRTSSALLGTSNAPGASQPPDPTGRPSFPVTATPFGEEGISRVTSKQIIGLYCNYALIGLINGCLVAVIAKPICMYVFDGVANEKVTYSQCNMGATLLQMPWNFKVFYAFLVDRVRLFGARRKYWMICGWTVSLALLGLGALFVDSFAKDQNWPAYMYLMMGTCFCYMFANVAADGLVVELSQLEPPERRGYIMTTAQMVRFGTTAGILAFNAILTNGPAMYPPTPGADLPKTLFDFGLNIWQLHLMLFVLAVPIYITMVVCIDDAPPSPDGQEQERETSVDALKNMWLTLKSKAMFMMIIFNVGFITIAHLGEPTSPALASIVVPTPILLSTSSLLGQLLFVFGVWIFRRYFMNVNWRFTCCWTGMLQQLETMFIFAIIYDFAGIGQSGAFYAFGDFFLSLVSGIAQVVSSLATIEIARPGLEATTYELLVTIHNCALAFNTNIVNTLMPVFNINEITGGENGTYTADGGANKDKYNTYMTQATLVCAGIQICGTLFFMWFLPATKEMCHTWKEDTRFHKTWVAVTGFCIAVVVFFYSITLSLFTLFPATSCLKIAGGNGCGNDDD